MPFQPQRSLNWLRQQYQLQPGRPAIAASVQTLLSVLGPIGIGVLVGHPTASAIAVISAWLVGLVNVEGAYRQQATAKVLAAISITVMLFLANVVHANLWLSAPTLFLVMFVAGFVGLYGQAASSISLMTSIMFIVALTQFAIGFDWSAVLWQCALCLAGGTWTIVVSLGIWVLRPYTPVVQAVANCYRSLSQLAELARERAANPVDRRSWSTRFLQAQDTFTQALATARRIWSAVWTAQRAANRTGNELLIFMEDTPQIANSIVTLVEQVSIASNHRLFLLLQPEIQQAMSQLATKLQQVSEAILTGNGSVNLQDLNQAIDQLQHRWQTLRSQLRSQTLPIHAEDYAELISLRKLVAILKQLAEQVPSDVALILGPHLKPDRTRSKLEIRYPPLPSLAAIVVPLRDNLTFHSILFRHALRLALIATIAEVIASLLQIPRGYWMTLTAVIALKPNYGGTSQTALQRVLGTVLGGMIGIAIVMLIHNPWLMWACLLVLMVVAVAVRPLSFSLFVTLLTPAIILLLNVASHGGWQVGATRIVDSFAGGLLALLGSYLLFPKWERQRLPAQLAITMRANLAYFQQAIAQYLDVSAATAEAIAPLRQQAALENANAAAAAQRLFSEPRHVQGNIEPITALLLYSRRFLNSTTALVEHRRELQGNYQCLDVQHFADVVIPVLENLSEAVQQGYSPHPLPDFNPYLEAIHEQTEQLQADRLSELAIALDSATPTLQALREQTPIVTELDRIAHEVAGMHRAIVRLLTV